MLNALEKRNIFGFNVGWSVTLQGGGGESERDRYHFDDLHKKACLKQHFAWIGHVLSKTDFAIFNFSAFSVPSQNAAANILFIERERARNAIIGSPQFREY